MFNIKVCNIEVFSKQIKMTAYLLNLNSQFDMTNQANALNFFCLRLLVGHLFEGEMILVFSFLGFFSWLGFNFFFSF